MTPLTLTQLLHELEPNGLYEGFQEGTITHPPTFKYDVGTSTFDTSEKQRTPSWTDRILWLSHTDSDTAEENRLQQSTLNACLDISLSDHKPISATFDVPVRRRSLTGSFTAVRKVQ